jgi:polygalacturonase
MIKRIFLLANLIYFTASTAFASETPLHLVVAPGTISANSATLVWDKPDHYADITRYHVFLNGKDIAVSNRCNYRLTGLKPSGAYQAYVKAEDRTGHLSAASSIVKFTSLIMGKVLDIMQYGARGDGSTINTKAIQKAIDDCPMNGTVRIPQGTFVSGALFLKSNMTLEIVKGGILKGSGNTDDYLPFINNRFEGWEMKTYASLINAGVTNNKGGFAVENLAIRGEGTISGAGGALGKAMIEKSGIRSRGRLILLMNCKNVDIQGLQIENSPCWTIHYLYSKGVSLHDLNIVSTARNGDGIDPDSSDDSYIFNCGFSTGDDCIAIKSGKNPEGYYISRPTRNVRITDCSFYKGHGISIGSEMSGGVSDVLVRDCQAGPLLHGMQIKGTKERGGYVKNVTVMDCKLQQITVFSAVNYNNDGEAAPQPPIFANYVFKNIDLTSASTKELVININGFKDPEHQLRSVKFTDIILPKNAVIEVNDAVSIHFSNVRDLTGNKPVFNISNSTDIEK